LSFQTRKNSGEIFFIKNFGDSFHFQNGSNFLISSKKFKFKNFSVNSKSAVKKFLRGEFFKISFHNFFASFSNFSKFSFGIENQQACSCHQK
jgi:hypothetical protein